MVCPITYGDHNQSKYEAMHCKTEQCQRLQMMLTLQEHTMHTGNVACDSARYGQSLKVKVTEALRGTNTERKICEGNIQQNRVC